MLVASSSRVHALIAAIAKAGAVGLFVIGLVGGPGAQAPGSKSTNAPGTLPVGQPVAPLSPPSLATIDQAGRTQDCTLLQLRRFRDTQGNVVAVRECLEIDADGSVDPRFVLTFVGVEGELPGSRTHTKWQQVYGRYASQFFSHASFRVRDLALAQANYSLHDFGPTIRAGRSARRMVVFPQSLDKAIWVIDVDAATTVPLYTAEFDAQMHLLAEVEALSFVPSVQALPATSPGATSSSTFSSFGAASAALTISAGLIDPDAQVVSEYQLDRIETRTDSLNGQQKLVMTYSDGIDQFMVVQAPGTTDLFAGLPANSPTNGTIGRYRDPSMSVLLFWEGGVSFQVAGRGAMHRLDDLAKRLYLQALSTN